MHTTSVACQRLHRSVTFYWKMLVGTGVLCDPIWSMDRHRAYITVITKLKWPKRSFLEKTIHYILQSNAWHDNDLNPLSPAKKWWTSCEGGQPHLEVEELKIISCAAQVQLPALCSWNTMRKFPPHDVWIMKAFRIRRSTRQKRAL